MTHPDALFRIGPTSPRDPRIEAWFAITDPLRWMVRPWFDRMRACGGDVREALHDGCPVACAADAPFAYVNAFTAHAAIGFFRGALLPDPAGLLQGTGKRMRHLRLRAGEAPDEAAIAALIARAYDDVRRALA